MSEKDLQEAAFNGNRGAMNVLARSYLNMSNEQLLRQNPDGFKYQSLGKYWLSGFMKEIQVNSNDSVKYDAGDKYPQIVEVPVNSCFLREDLIKKSIAIWEEQNGKLNI